MEANMEDYDPNRKSLYLLYWNINNIYEQVISQKLPVNDFEWDKKNLHLMKTI